MSVFLLLSSLNLVGSLAESLFLPLRAITTKTTKKTEITKTIKTTKIIEITETIETTKTIDT